METKEARQERMLNEGRERRRIMVALVKSMTNDGLDESEVSHLLMPVFGAGVTVAQVRRIKANTKEGE
jgi:hypothetical protein